MHRAIVFFFREPHILPIVEMLKERPATSYTRVMIIYRVFPQEQGGFCALLFTTNPILNNAAHRGNIWPWFTRLVYLICYRPITAQPWLYIHSSFMIRQVIVWGKEEGRRSGFGRSLLGSPFSWTLMVGCKRPWTIIPSMPRNIRCADIGTASYAMTIAPPPPSPIDKELVGKRKWNTPWLLISSSQ